MEQTKKTTAINEFLINLVHPDKFGHAQFYNGAKLKDDIPCLMYVNIEVNVKSTTS